MQLFNQKPKINDTFDYSITIWKIKHYKSLFSTAAQTAESPFEYFIATSHRDQTIARLKPLHVGNN